MWPSIMQYHAHNNGHYNALTKHPVSGPQRRAAHKWKTDYEL